MFINPGESGGGKETNGIDDDGNGKIDDFRGWDFVNNDNNPADDNGITARTWPARSRRAPTTASASRAPRASRPPPEAGWGRRSWR